MNKTLKIKAFTENVTEAVSSDSPVTFVPNENDQTIADRIRILIDDEFVSSFARRCGMGESLIRKYLAGAQPNAANLVAIANAKGVTVDWLATGREPKYRKDVVAAMQRLEAPQAAPYQASGDLDELVAIYKEAPSEGRNALLSLARAIRDRTLRAWLAAGQTIAETASIFDRSK